MGNDTDLPTLLEEDENTRSTHLSNTRDLDETDLKNDGIILKNSGNKEFPPLNQISPILKLGESELDRTTTKRQRNEDEFDNISIDSSVMSLSTKKPKLMRTGSITKNLRKSLSFGIIKTPINSMFRSRRNSVDHDISASASMISMESTFNETITKPFKEKLRRIKDKVSKIGKKDHDTPKMLRKERSFIMPSDNVNESKSSLFMNQSMCGVLKTPEKDRGQCNLGGMDFKTPVMISEYNMVSKSTDAHYMKNKEKGKIIANDMHERSMVN
jgi:hypothetical protein